MEKYGSEVNGRGLATRGFRITLQLSTSKTSAVRMQIPNVLVFLYKVKTSPAAIQKMPPFPRAVTAGMI